MIAVGILIATLVGLGVVFVLPHWPVWLHLPPTLWLSFVVLFNYHAAVTMDPGERIQFPCAMQHNSPPANCLRMPRTQAATSGVPGTP